MAAGKTKRAYVAPTTDGKYVVVKTVNTLRVKLGQYLNEREVEQLMLAPGFDVTVQQMPRG